VASELHCITDHVCSERVAAHSKSGSQDKGPARRSSVGLRLRNWVDAKHRVIHSDCLESRHRGIMPDRQMLAATRGDFASGFENWRPLPKRDFGQYDGS
jgi:hypothetical protein